MTLIEIMLVLVIIGILGSFAYPYYTRVNARAHCAEAQLVLNKLNLYFINLFENNGSYGSSVTSAYDPDPSTAPIGQDALWSSSANGWTLLPFGFDGGLKMRYSYQTAADGQSMTITVEGSIPGLGAALAQSPNGGNYLFVETLSGTTITSVEVPTL